MKKKLNILLADDDEDDRFFFAETLKKISIPTTLVTVQDGEKLIEYLLKSPTHIPDVLFLDIDMPRKKGSECLSEIKNNKKIKEFPIIIYSTCGNDSMVYDFYEMGAHYCMKKGDLAELLSSLQYILKLLLEEKFIRPTREHFIIHPEVEIHA